MSGFGVPNFLYIFTIFGTLSIKDTFSISSRAFIDKFTFSANSPPFVFNGDTDLVISNYVWEYLIYPIIVIVAKSIIKNGSI